VIGAILVVGPDAAGAFQVPRNPAASLEGPESLAQQPIACLDVLGASVLTRAVQRFERAGVHTIAVMGTEALSNFSAALPADSRVEIGVVYRQEHLWAATQRRIAQFAGLGVDSLVLQRLGPYVDLDVADFLRFYQASGHACVRAFGQDGAGSLDLWMMRPDRFLEESAQPWKSLHITEDREEQRYVVSGYVNALESAYDLRRLAVYGLLGRCGILPAGEEAKPGVWIHRSANVHHTARIVAPAYIGAHAVVRAAALVTRFTTIERGSEVDYGTVVEDTTVLPDTYLGAWLDVSHAVVSGSTLVHLRRGVTVDIEDEKLVSRVSPYGKSHPSVALSQFSGPEEPVPRKLWPG
jgi:hypothetical protein